MRRPTRTRSLIALLLLCAAGAAAVAGCSTAGSESAAGAGSPGAVIDVGASINAWGSVLAQLGGARVSATSIISNPATDPHDYEPTPRDGVLIARSRLFVENGVGYDSWAARSLAASPDSHRLVLNVGELVGVKAGGNPHRWYSPTDVATVADAITAGLTRLDPADAAYYAGRRREFLGADLATYDRLIATIRAQYAGTPIGASESVFSPMAESLGLDVRTPPAFLRAISEGSDPAPSDLSTIAAQIRAHAIAVYVLNRQNATPDVSAQAAAARAAGIPVISVTETLPSRNGTFEQWQAGQLEALAAALHTATGR